MAFIALLSDLGDNDTGVARVKSTLLQQMPDATLIDVTHNIQPYYVPQASYHLASCLKDFPTGTSFIVLFDIYYSAQPKLILSEVEGRFVYAPDNGTIPHAFPNIADTRLIYEPAIGDNIVSWAGNISSCILDVASNNNTIAHLPLHTTPNAPLHLNPVVTPNGIEAHVIHIDRFENVVLNIRKHDFEAAAQGRRFSINVLREEPITEISDQYNSVGHGIKLCRFNSAGYMEIAINNGKAASLFGLRIMHGSQHLMYSSVKIKFE